MNTQTVTFVNATDLIPESWNSWFWASLSESSTITFGDNDFSLISAERFKIELDGVLDFEDEVDKDEVESLHKTLIALQAEDVYVSL